MVVLLYVDLIYVSNAGSFGRTKNIVWRRAIYMYIVVVHTSWTKHKVAQH